MVSTPSEKYESKWESFPQAGGKKKSLKPPPSNLNNFETKALANRLRSHLKVDGWKMSFPFGMAYYQGLC